MRVSLDLICELIIRDLYARFLDCFGLDLFGRQTGVLSVLFCSFAQNTPYRSLCTAKVQTCQKLIHANNELQTILLWFGRVRPPNFGDGLGVLLRKERCC